MSKKNNCPFCGAELFLDERIYAAGTYLGLYNDVKPDRFRLLCKTCDAIHWYKTKAEALAACKLLPLYEHAEEMKELLEAALPLIECPDQNASGLISCIGALLKKLENDNE